MITLNALFIYPVKSLAGIEVNAWEVTKTGLKYDRQWMLVDAEKRFLSQRSHPKMALIKTAIQAQQLIISAPNQQSLYLDLAPTFSTVINIDIWDELCEAHTISQEANQWFSDVLGEPCELVYQAESAIRAVDPKYANTSDQTAFSDGFPFLIASDASLALLNQQMGLNLSMERFRPNLVLTGCSSYAEDTWRRIRIGNIDFRLPKACSRCSVPQINPETATIDDKEPLRTLARTRQWDNKVFFGQNALHNQTGILKIDDIVSIQESGTAQPPL